MKECEVVGSNSPLILECVEMNEYLADVKTGKMKGTSSDGADHKINTNLSGRQSVFGAVVSCKSYEHATGGRSSLHGTTKWQA